MIINAIVAIGNQGQIGIDGRLPWRNSADLKWFKEMTMDGILICGYNTYIDLPDLEGRTVLCDDTSVTPTEFLARIRTEKPIWIIGGGKTYDRYKHLINRWHIGSIDYSGNADTYFDPSILIKGKK